jgi:hypothetical protein
MVQAYEYLRPKVCALPNATAEPVVTSMTDCNNDSRDGDGEGGRVFQREPELELESALD